MVTANWQLVAASLDTGGRKLKQLEVMETTTDKNGRVFLPGIYKAQSVPGRAARCRIHRY